MPVSVLHDEIATLLRAILASWAEKAASCLVARDLAVRWDETHPQFGVDPDVAVFEPAPPTGSSLRSVRTWDTGHGPPLLAVEIVSETNPHKDYLVAPDKYAASGTQELWMFDPLLSGPRSQGGPFRLQVWSRDAGGDFVRTHAGEAPARSSVLEAYIVVVDDGQKLRIANDREGKDLWLTAEERERAAKEAALARVRELEAELAARSR